MSLALESYNNDYPNHLISENNFESTSKLLGKNGRNKKYLSSRDTIIKKGILKRKVSGGSMSEEGVRAYAILQSISQTCHLRKLSFLKFLKVNFYHIHFHQLK